MEFRVTIFYKSSIFTGRFFIAMLAILDYQRLTFITFTTVAWASETPRGVEWVVQRNMICQARMNKPWFINSEIVVKFLVNYNNDS